EWGAAGRAGGGVRERPGWCHEPTVLASVPTGARIDREEIFGPVVTVARVSDERAAVAAANASAYGLGASVWTSDPARAARVEAGVRAGSVWHNDHAYSYGAAQAPGGGAALSGPRPPPSHHPPLHLPAHPYPSP